MTADVHGQLFLLPIKVKEGDLKPSSCTRTVEVIGEASRKEGGLKAVLGLWREKVFALLVQLQLQQLQHSREKQDAQCRVSQHVDNV